MIIVLILRGQHVPTHADVQRLDGAMWQTVALAIGFAVSIPLYLFIGQWAFAVWAAASLFGNVIHSQRRRWAAKAA